MWSVHLTTSLYSARVSLIFQTPPLDANKEFVNNVRAAVSPAARTAAIISCINLQCSLGLAFAAANAKFYAIAVDINLARRFLSTAAFMCCYGRV